MPEHLHVRQKVWQMTYRRRGYICPPNFSDSEIHPRRQEIDLVTTEITKRSTAIAPEMVFVQGIRIQGSNDQKIGVGVRGREDRYATNVPAVVTRRCDPKRLWCGGYDAVQSLPQPCPSFIQHDTVRETDTQVGNANMVRIDETNDLGKVRGGRLGADAAKKHQSGLFTTIDKHRGDMGAV